MNSRNTRAISKQKLTMNDSEMNAQYLALTRVSIDIILLFHDYSLCLRCSLAVLQIVLGSNVRFNIWKRMKVSSLLSDLEYGKKILFWLNWTNFKYHLN